MQEALARAWERDGRGHHIQSLEAWVTKAAMNLARSRWRRMRLERRQHESLPIGKEPSGESVDLRRALAALPRRQRETTILRYYLDLDVREIASALAVTEGTVKTQLHRARRTLARALGEQELEESNDHV